MRVTNLLIDFVDFLHFVVGGPTPATAAADALAADADQVGRRHRHHHQQEGQLVQTGVDGDRGLDVDAGVRDPAGHERAVRSERHLQNGSSNIANRIIS